MSNKRDILEETDRVLRGLDDDLRVAQDVRLRAAVDRLLESAAQSVSPAFIDTVVPTQEQLEEWGYSSENLEDWDYYIRWSENGNERLCLSGECRSSSLMTSHRLDCNKAYDHAGAKLELIFSATGYRGPIVSGLSFCNLDVLMDPPDGVETMYHAYQGGVTCPPNIDLDTPEEIGLHAESEVEGMVVYGEPVHGITRVVVVPYVEVELYMFDPSQLMREYRERLLASLMREDE